VAVDIVPFEEIGPEKWDDYVLSHPEGTLFHLSKWKTVVEKSFGHRSLYCGAVTTDHQEKLVGVISLFSISSLLFGHYLVSTPFAEIGGPLAESADIEKDLVHHAGKIADEIGVDYFEMRNRRPIEGFETKELYVNFRKEIDPDPEVNLKAIPKKQRRMVRQGRKHELTAEFGNHQLQEFFNIVARSYHNLGTPIFGRHFFQNFIDLFGDEALIEVVRTKEGKPIASVLSFFFKNQVLPYYAGSLFEYRKLAPNDFMYWELMTYACTRGYKWFDYGRSKVDTGSYHFKRHWGFEPQPLAYQYYLVNLQEMPNLSPANPKYQKKVEMWKRLPFFVTKIVGPPIARYLA
jgi:FemAB-related protein (PEP-CTERM system-associated)